MGNTGEVRDWQLIGKVRESVKKIVDKDLVDFEVSQNPMTGIIFINLAHIKWGYWKISIDQNELKGLTDHGIEATISELIKETAPNCHKNYQKETGMIITANIDDNSRSFYNVDSAIIYSNGKVHYLGKGSLEAKEENINISDVAEKNTNEIIRVYDKYGNYHEYEGESIEAEVNNSTGNIWIREKRPPGRALGFHAHGEYIRLEFEYPN